MYSHVVIYQKPDGSLIYRAVDSLGVKSVGDTNRYGWEIVGIQKMFHGKCLSAQEYDSLLCRKRKWSRAKEIFLNIINKIDPTQLFKWGIIGYALLRMCQ